MIRLVSSSFLLALSIALSCVCFAQKTSTATFPAMMPGPVDQQAKSSLREIYERELSLGQTADFVNAVPDEVIAKLEASARANQYDEVGRYVRGAPLDPKISDWMTKRANGGDVLMMWHLADRFAYARTYDPAIKWAYAALMGTMQERALCLDDDVYFAPGIISEQHGRLIKLSRSNPFALKDAKIFAMKVLMKAPAYPDPVSWLCKPYSSIRRSLNPVAFYAFEPIYYPYLRARERNRLRKSLAIDDAVETLPPLPKPLPPQATSANRSTSTPPLIPPFAK